MVAIDDLPAADDERLSAFMAYIFEYIANKYPDDPILPLMREIE